MERKCTHNTFGCSRSHAVCISSVRLRPVLEWKWQRRSPDRQSPLDHQTEIRISIQTMSGLYLEYVASSLPDPTIQADILGNTRNSGFYGPSQRCLAARD